MNRTSVGATLVLCVAIFTTTTHAADADNLAGIHWWGWRGAGVDPQPAELLDSVNRGGWDVEIVQTHGEPWQNAAFHQPLYHDLYTNKNISMVTRVEYKYGWTVPSPATINTNTWANNVVGLVNTLKDYGHIWQLGNEPNLTGEGHGWTDNRITPGGYADVYRTVRNAVRNNAQVGAPGQHQVLVAPVSPGGVAGERWMDGNQWLKETLDAIPVNEVDGVALHSYGGGATTADALRDFRRGLAEQIAVIDARGLGHVPLHITEWNRYANPLAPDAAQQEAVAADFVREAFKFLNQWNHRPGNHNIISMSYFVYHPYSNMDGNGAWDGYSIEYWKNNGNPAGHPGDLYTAYAEAARLYNAGITGTRPLPAGVQIFDDFETDYGRFTWTLQQSQNAGVASSWKVRTADDSFTKSYSQKLAIFGDNIREQGWYTRYVSGGGSPSSNVPIFLTTGTDGYIGFFLRVLTHSGDGSGFKTQIVLDSGSTGGGNNSDAGVLRDIIADGNWHFYQWNLDDPNDWTSWFITGSDGNLGTNGDFTGQVTVDSIMFYGPKGSSIEIFFDGVMRNANGSLQVMMIPEPASVGTLLLIPFVLNRRRRS